MNLIAWVSEKTVSKGDYNYSIVRNHPNSTKYGYVLEHRVVVENSIKRLLRSNEIVHHKNGNKKDNRIENLEIMSASDHARIHHSGKKVCEVKCPECGVLFCTDFRSTHLGKKSSSSTSCSSKCRGRFSHKLKLKDKDENVKRALSMNIQKVYMSTDF